MGDESQVTAPGQEPVNEPVHGGVHALAAAKAHAVEAMFTLSGAHVFPMYDAAVTSEPTKMPIIDVRHEPSAVFAAEATGKLTRKPGLAVLTAGPGVTNGVSGVAQAYFSGAPLVLIGGRAPAGTWGQGTLQEIDHPPIFATITKSARTAATIADIGPVVDEAFTVAGASHRGPTFVDIPMDEFFQSAPLATAPARLTPAIEPDGDSIDQITQLIAAAERPVLVLGSDVWADHSEEAALRFVQESGIPTIANGMGRGILAPENPLLVTKARSTAFGTCDLAIVVGTALDFRLGFGRFGGKEGTEPAKTVHVQDSPGQLSTTATLAGSAAGDLSTVFDLLLAAVQSRPSKPDWTSWTGRLRDEAAAAKQRDAVLLASDSDPIHPARIYGELLPRLAEDAVVIGDGGDFVSFAGKFVEPARPGNWLDPGPYGCLGAGLGAAMAARIARPSSQVVVLFGDGAAGMSLMDVDTLVRHDLPVVMIVGNNSAWGLEKMPMQLIYGYDVAADLAPGTRYDQVVTALGGGGELVTRPRDIGPALDRAFSSGIPYLVNILTDVDAQYPRATSGI